jgi:hypothetical protein
VGGGPNPVHAGIAERGKPQAPTLIIVGGVVNLHDKLAWFPPQSVGEWKLWGQVEGSPHRLDAAGIGKLAAALRLLGNRNFFS